MIHKLISSGNSIIRHDMHWMRYSKMVCKTLDNYCASADDELTSAHVPEHYLTYECSAQGIVALENEISHSVRMVGSSQFILIIVHFGRLLILTPS